MTLPSQTPNRAPELGPPVDVEAVVGELRQRGFDLRRAVFMTYLLEVGTDRDGAYAVRDRAAADGWQATLFGDETGWVVRIGRLGLARAEPLRRDAGYAEGLAQGCGGSLRGVCVEDLRREDVWEELAARAGQTGRPVADRVPRVPAPRRPPPAYRPARSA